MILRAKNGFGAKKVKFSEKVRNGGKWSPKHLKKHWFRKLLSDGAGNGIPDTKKVGFFEKIALFAKICIFPFCCEFSEKERKNRSGTEKLARMLIFPRKYQHFLKVHFM